MLLGVYVDMDGLIPDDCHYSLLAFCERSCLRTVVLELVNLLVS
jgi:hypothetical protein